MNYAQVYGPAEIVLKAYNFCLKALNIRWKGEKERWIYNICRCLIWGTFSAICTDFLFCIDFLKGLIVAVLYCFLNQEVSAYWLITLTHHKHTKYAPKFKIMCWKPLFVYNCKVHASQFCVWMEIISILRGLNNICTQNIAQ